MDKNITPFWVEGMSKEDRNKRVSEIFTLIEQKFIAEPNHNNAIKTGTYVFVADPPPLNLQAATEHLDADSFSWGTAGQAIATEDKKVAMALAPVIFNLWPESLYVVVFNARSSGKPVLGKWLNYVLVSEPHTESIQKIKPPEYTVITFDWGDLVGTSQDQDRHLNKHRESH